MPCVAVVNERYQESEGKLKKGVTKRRVLCVCACVESRCFVHLCHGDDVRDHAVGLEAPEVAADAREARLDLVGDAEAAGLPHGVVRRSEERRVGKECLL